jgi:hypothetical protein
MIKGTATLGTLTPTLSHPEPMRWLATVSNWNGITQHPGVRLPGCRFYQAGWLIE